jgi:LmbE family N-acetylglucosaminyl deacetylase
MIRIFSSHAALKSFKNVIILAPHPDDEILGIGGILLQIRNYGGKIHIVYLTDGENSGVWHDKEEIRRIRITLSEKVCKILDLEHEDITRLHLSDGSVPHPGQAGFLEAVAGIRAIIEEIKPDAVFATHKLDYWPYDHVACANIAFEAVRQSLEKPQLWNYWVWAWYNIRPWQIFGQGFRKLEKIDIRDQMPQKKKLMDIYLKSLTPDIKPWSGVLPTSLLKAFDYPYEIVERIF